MSTPQRDHANNMPRKGKGPGGGQFKSKGGPRATAATPPTVNLNSSSTEPGSSDSTDLYSHPDYPASVRNGRLGLVERGETKHTVISSEQVKGDVKQIAYWSKHYFGEQLWDDARRYVQLSHSHAAQEGNEMMLDDVYGCIKNALNRSRAAWGKKIEGVATIQSVDNVVGLANNAESIHRLGEVKHLVPIHKTPEEDAANPWPTVADVFPDETMARMCLVRSTPRLHPAGDGPEIDMEQVVIEVGVPTQDELMARWMNEEFDRWKADKAEEAVAH